MKKLIVLLGFAVFACAATDTNLPQPQKPVSSDCSHLSDQEKLFAAELSDMHRTMFCRHFSVTQRIEAMTLASPEVEKLTGQKTDITPDMAVETVMKNARQNKGTKKEMQTKPNPYSNYSGPQTKSANPYSNDHR